MSCFFSQELLALHSEGDLSQPEAIRAAAHLAICDECRGFLERLGAGQSLVKLLRQRTISNFDCDEMRRRVMARVQKEGIDGFLVKIERGLTLTIWKHVYAFAAVAIVAIVSFSVLAQIRHVSPALLESARFESDGTFLRPEHYRDWVFIGTPSHKVYMNPAAYREYERTRTFPEGTVLVLEPSETDHAKQSQLLASVKDHTRFEGGWGYFDFSGPDGRVKTAAEALPASTGCITCHQRRADTDHVFTRFYPALRSALEEPRHAAPLSQTISEQRNL